MTECIELLQTIVFHRLGEKLLGIPRYLLAINYNLSNSFHYALYSPREVESSTSKPLCAPGSLFPFPARFFFAPFFARPSLSLLFSIPLLLFSSFPSFPSSLFFLSSSLHHHFWFWFSISPFPLDSASSSSQLVWFYSSHLVFHFPPPVVLPGPDRVNLNPRHPHPHPSILHHPSPSTEFTPIRHLPPPCPQNTLARVFLKKKPRPCKQTPSLKSRITDVLPPPDGRVGRRTRRPLTPTQTHPILKPRKKRKLRKRKSQLVLPAVRVKSPRRPRLRARRRSWSSRWKPRGLLLLLLLLLRQTPGPRRNNINTNSSPPLPNQLSLLQLQLLKPQLLRKLQFQLQFQLLLLLQLPLQFLRLRLYRHQLPRPLLLPPRHTLKVHTLNRPVLPIPPPCHSHNRIRRGLTHNHLLPNQQRHRPGQVVKTLTQSARLSALLLPHLRTVLRHTPLHLKIIIVPARHRPSRVLSTRLPKAHNLCIPNLLDLHLDMCRPFPPQRSPPWLLHPHTLP